MIPERYNDKRKQENIEKGFSTVKYGLCDFVVSDWSFLFSLSFVPMKKKRLRSTRITVSVPKRLRVEMDEFQKTHNVNWSRICGKAILKHIEAKKGTEEIY